MDSFSPIVHTHQLMRLLLLQHQYGPGELQAERPGLAHLVLLIRLGLHAVVKEVDSLFLKVRSHRRGKESERGTSPPLSPPSLVSHSRRGSPT